MPTAKPAKMPHALPADMRKFIDADAATRGVWDTLTPLSRNEWICWVISAKQEGTRQKRLGVMRDQMKHGQRRPCCWIGCVHRTNKKISPSVQWVLSRGAKRAKK